MEWLEPHSGEDHLLKHSILQGLVSFLYSCLYMLTVLISFNVVFPYMHSASIDHGHSRSSFHLQAPSPFLSPFLVPRYHHYTFRSTFKIMTETESHNRHLCYITKETRIPEKLCHLPKISQPANCINS